MENTENILEVKNLSVSFHTPDGEIEALRDVSFSLKPGETLAVVGESGCGKSVLCRTIMKLIPKNAYIKTGTIQVNNANITDYSQKEMRQLRGALFSMIFQDPMTSLNPTISVGGILKAIHGNIRVGGHDTFITEACEYTNSFLSFFPTISIILNIDADHLDFFKDLDDIRHSFRKFAQLLPDDGTLIVNSEIEHLDQLTEGLTCKIVTYGMDASSDYYASNITFDEFAHPSFDCYKGDTLLGHFVLHVPGIHNVSNALASIALSDQMGVSMEHTRIGLEKFGGTKRRFEKKGEIGGVTIIDDYAHHPTEIEATLHAAHNYPHKKLWCVFQPHTYTRTKALMDDFAKALTLADHVVLADIYAARETDTLGISSSMLAEKVNALGGCADYFDSFDKIETCLLENCKPGDVLITMGAGDVVKIGEKLLGK